VFPGIGTLVNVVAVLVGAVLGVLVGHGLTQRTRHVVTDALGLVTLLIAASSISGIADPAWAEPVGDVLILLGFLLLGGIAGSLLGIEDRLDGFGGRLQARLGGRGGGHSVDRQRLHRGLRVQLAGVLCGAADRPRLAERRAREWSRPALPQVRARRLRRRGVRGLPGMGRRRQRDRGPRRPGHLDPVGADSVASSRRRTWQP
jgi:hypothetical protein